MRCRRARESTAAGHSAVGLSFHFTCRWSPGTGVCVNVCRIASHPWLLPVNLYRLDLYLEMLFSGHSVICRVLSLTALAEAWQEDKEGEKIWLWKTILISRCSAGTEAGIEQLFTSSELCQR